MFKLLKRSIGHLLYLLVFGYLTYRGLLYQDLLHQEAGRTYQVYSMVSFWAYFPIGLGLFLALPSFIHTLFQSGGWDLDWGRLVGIGMPSLYIAVSPLLMYYNPAFVPSWMDMFLRYEGIRLLGGLIFGYNFLRCFEKKNHSLLNPMSKY